jgi:hypothetical protein
VLLSAELFDSGSGHVALDHLLRPRAVSAVGRQHSALHKQQRRRWSRRRQQQQQQLQQGGCRSAAMTAAQCQHVGTGSAFFGGDSSRSCFWAVASVTGQPALPLLLHRMRIPLFPLVPPVPP